MSATTLAAPTAAPTITIEADPKIGLVAICVTRAR